METRGSGIIVSRNVSVINNRVYLDQRTMELKERDGEFSQFYLDPCEFCDVVFEPAFNSMI